MEALPPGLPIKSKARRVAQQKQRPSECSEDGFMNEESKLRTGQTPPGALTSLDPPPGFEAAANSMPPPPGFESVPSSMQSQSQSQNGPSTTKPLSSIDPINNRQPIEHQYTRPANFDMRNRALFDRLCALMNNDDQRIQEFKKASSEFRRGDLEPHIYCENIRRLLNDDGAYVRIFSELVCLLPDIQRQNALWEAFRIGSASITGGGPSGNDFVKRCSRCGQLLVKIDYYDHAQQAHSSSAKGKGNKANVEEEYPALC